MPIILKKLESDKFVFIAPKDYNKVWNPVNIKDNFLKTYITQNFWGLSKNLNFLAGMLDKTFRGVMEMFSLVLSMKNIIK